MAAGINLASKYSTNVDERFYKESQAALALNNDYDFVGVETVKVYSIPVAVMNDYNKNGAHPFARYGNPSDLTRNVQTLTLTRDRSFTFVIDKGDKIMSEMVSDAGKALSRQLREVCVPEYDTYVFNKLAAAATAAGNFDSTAATKQNAYELFLNAQEKLGNNNIPDQGRVCFCSYRFANLLKMDPAFMQYGDSAHAMTQKGVIGEVDGCKIVKVPATRLPLGCAFLLAHPIAATGPKVLEDYRIHDNPPGINGWLVEGRFIYDAFVLNEKRDAIFYQGAQAILGMLDVRTFASDVGKTSIMVNGELPTGHSYAYMETNDVATDLAGITYNQTVSGTTALTTNPLEITPTSGMTDVIVVELDASSKAVAVGVALINVG